MRYLLKNTAFLVLMALNTSTGFADGQCTDAIVGINLAGAEFGQVPGRAGWDYQFPSSTQIAYFSKVGFRSIRLPILWERLQPKLNGSLDPQYLAGIISFLNAAADNGMDVLIDLHNYARYNKKLIGTDEVPTGAFFDIWQKLAHALSPYKALYAYGLMNEPYHTGGAWLQVAQSGVDAIRSVDHTHRIYVAVEGDGGPNAWTSKNHPFVKDPMNLEVYEFHAYFDSNFSGTYSSLTPPKDPRILVDERVGPYIAWLANYGKTGAVGEWGVPNNDERWFPAVDHMIELARANCLRTYYWAAGNWSPGYKLSLRPVNGDGPERLLTKHFSKILKEESK